MSYELFQQGPAVYIPVILISLVVTIVAYGAIPFIVSRMRKKPITKKKYNSICYGWNFAVMILFIAINGKSSGAPYFLWTWVFARNGINTLARRGVLKGPGSECHEDDPNRIIECKSCGHRSKEYFEECPQCGKHAKQYVYDEQGRQALIKPCFCRICGEKLTDGVKFCRKCGTEVIELPQ